MKRRDGGQRGAAPCLPRAGHEVSFVKDARGFSWRHGPEMVLALPFDLEA